ncbi:MAG: zf-HC2 domain-containing protein [Armatimonadota bacterium]|jgi:anti-sigma factor RsiW|nr:hypothetical protein [Armatimonadota bacterium]
MNCKECYRYLGEYVDRTLDDCALAEMEAHIRVCPKCASLAAELGGVASLVKSLDRQAAPSGFEDRLNAQILHRKEEAKPGLLRRLLLGVPPEVYGYRRSLGPALATVLLTAAVGTSLMFTNYNASGDAAYINAVQQQHVTFASANPLSDESALILSDRMKELNEPL